MSPFIDEMSVAEVAHFSGVSHRTVQRWIKKGRVKSRLFRGKRMIDAATLPYCHTTVSHDSMSQQTLVELATIVQQLIELQPVSDMRSLSKRQALRDAVGHLLMRLDDTNRD